MTTKITIFIRNIMLYIYISCYKFGMHAISICCGSNASYNSVGNARRRKCRRPADYVSAPLIYVTYLYECLINSK